MAGKKNNTMQAEPEMEQQQQPVKEYNCLSNKTVIVRSIHRPSNLIKDPNHILYDGPENHIGKFVTPMIGKNQYVNVLTNEEKACLEKILKRDLSVYARENNIWDEIEVELHKGDNRFDMSNPMDYIKLKILKANKQVIAPSVSALTDRPKATYRYVITDTESDRDIKMQKHTFNQQANRLLGKMEDDRQSLITLLEILDRKPVSDKISQVDLLDSLDGHINLNARLFVKCAEDPLLKTKSLLRRCVAKGLVHKKGDFYYDDKGNPLCEKDQDPTFSVAAAYIADPRRAEVKYSLEKALAE